MLLSVLDVKGAKQFVKVVKRIINKSDYYQNSRILNSTLLFTFLPSAVVLSAIGCDGP